MTGTRTTPPTIARDDAHNGLPRQQPLDDDELARLDAYWRAANYLSVGRICLIDNPLLAHLRQDQVEARVRARAHTREQGEDLPEISGITRAADRRAWPRR